METAEVIKKKRKAILTMGGITTTLSYGFVTDEEFDKSIEDWAAKVGIKSDMILTYTLGDEEEMKNGNMYFCPNCGTYNECGYEPDLNLYYKTDKETGETKPAGYIKTVMIDCTDCDETFIVNCERFSDEAEKLTKDMKDIFESDKIQ